MVKTPAMATVYPTTTSSAVVTPALAPKAVSTYVMKLPADGSALVNSATVKARSATAPAAATIVSGAAGSYGDHPEGEVKVDPWADIGNRRRCHVHRAQLAALEVFFALAHRAP